MIKPCIEPKAQARNTRNRIIEGKLTSQMLKSMGYC